MNDPIESFPISGPEDVLARSRASIALAAIRKELKVGSYDEVVRKSLFHLAGIIAHAEYSPETSSQNEASFYSKNPDHSIEVIRAAFEEEWGPSITWNHIKEGSEGKWG